VIWVTVPRVSSVIQHLSRLLRARLGLLLVSGDQRDAEIIALRHQILVLQRQINQPQATTTDRTTLAALSRAFDPSQLERVMLIVKPDTVIGWHRHLLARHWTQPRASNRAATNPRQPTKTTQRSSTSASRSSGQPPAPVSSTNTDQQPDTRPTPTQHQRHRASTRPSSPPLPHAQPSDPQEYDADDF